MKWVTGVLCGLLIFGSGAALLWSRGASIPAAASADVSVTEPGLEPSAAASSSGAVAEVRRLRAELRQKDAVILALSKKQAAAPGADREGAQPPPVPSPQPEQQADPVAHAVDVLDERMFLAAAGTRQAVEMEQAVRDAIQSIASSDAKVESLYCTSALCKLTLSAPTQDSAQQSLRTLNDRLSKTISNATVYDLGGGESAMYLAQSSEALDVAP